MEKLILLINVGVITAAALVWLAVTVAAIQVNVVLAVVAGGLLVGGVGWVLSKLV